MPKPFNLRTLRDFEIKIGLFTDNSKQDIYMSVRTQEFFEPKPQLVELYRVSDGKFAWEASDD